MKLTKKITALLLALVMSLGLMAPGVNVAHAESDTYKITSYKVLSWYGDIPSNYAFELTNGTQQLHGICADPYANPGGVGATVTLGQTDDVILGMAYYASQTNDATELYNIHHAVAEYIGKNNNVMNSDIRWYLDHAAANAANAPASFMAYITARPSDGGQIMLVWGDKPTGDLTLTKSSANTTITSGNSCYSLAGAVYGVYTSEANAQSDSNRVGTLTTNADGTANTITGLHPATYYLRELTAPKGFALNPAIISIKVESGKTATGNVTDYPQSDPVGILLRKADSKTGGAPASNALSLEGAEFTVKYYDGQYSTAAEAESNGATARTWVFKTDSDGEIEFHSNWKVSGDEFYTDSRGIATLPLGTIVIQETKAPAGYQINSTKYVVQITSGGASTELVDTYNAPTITEEPDTGKAKLIKTSEDGKVEGIEFTITGPNNYSQTVKTDANGNVELTDLYPGDYTAVETVPNRYKPQEPQTITVNPGETGSFSFDNALIRGGVKVRKYDAETGDIDQGDATLAGAQFDIISLNDYPVIVNGETYNQDDVVYSFATGDDGVAETTADLLPYGRFAIVETAPPTGYTTKGHISQEFSVTEDGQIYDLSLDNADRNQDTVISNEVIEGCIHIVKHSDLGKTGPATPEVGAQFELYLASVGSYDAAKESERDLLTIDEDGFATSKMLPYGKYVVHQISGFASSPFVDDFIVNIQEDGKTYSFILNNQTFSGYLKVVKLDARTGEIIPVEGVGFKLYDPNDQLITFFGDDTWYTGKDGIVRVPAELTYNYGYYLIEQNAPDGYVLSQDPVYFDVVPDAAIDEYNMKIIPVEFPNEPTKVQISKQDMGGKELPGAKMSVMDKDGNVVDEWTSAEEPHMIYNLLIGETYTLREDTAPLGYVKATEIQFTIQDTAEVQPVVMIDKVLSVAKVDYTGAYVPGAELAVYENDKMVEKWISADEPHAVSGLKVGHAYLLRELSAPEGWLPADPIEFTVTDDMKDQVINMEDEEIPEIHTTATVDDGHMAQASGTVTLVDRVFYDKLIPGREYTLTGTLMVKETGEALLDKDGNPYVSSVTFTPEDPTGYVDVTFEIDASDLAGQTVVAFEDLSKNDKTLVVHADIEDEEQSVHFPEIHTTATVEDSHIAQAAETVTLTDVVTYTNLIPGKKYTVTGVLMDQATGEAVLDKNGKEITAKTSFTPETADGSVEVTFTFEASELTGRSTVVFEDLYEGDLLLADHTDIEDEGQTVHFPEIRTTLTGEGGIHMAKADKKLTLVDTVSYTNLIPGKKYTVTGVLMDQETGEAVLDKNGEKITAKTAFTPETADGTVEVTFAFDASELDGKTVVAFEELYEKDRLLAVHADIEDGEQSVNIPKIRTTATVDGSHVALAAESVTLIDVVTYKNLIPGKEYTVVGKLMDQRTGKVFKTTEGKEITAEATFTPETADGTVEVTFVFNASLLAGHSTVVFEDLYHEDILVATHADINDEDQTVHFPEVKTTATVNGNHKATPTESVTLTDVVKYDNLIPGKEYTVRGTLMVKETGKALLDKNGKPVTAEAPFVPEKASGKVELTFTFDASDLGSKSVVAFEEVYENDRLIAVHADINDKDQTVEFPENPNTGDTFHVGLWAALMAASGSTAAAAVWFTKRRKRAAEAR